MDAVTALPSLARGLPDGITRHIGLILGKGPPFVYLPSWVPTMAAIKVLPTHMHEGWSVYRFLNEYNSPGLRLHLTDLTSLASPMYYLCFSARS